MYKSKLLNPENYKLIRFIRDHGESIMAAVAAGKGVAKTIREAARKAGVSADRASQMVMTLRELEILERIEESSGLTLYELETMRDNFSYRDHISQVAGELELLKIMEQSSGLTEAELETMRRNLKRRGLLT